MLYQKNKTVKKHIPRPTGVPLRILPSSSITVSEIAMGLVGKAISKTKMAAKSVDSKLGEGVDVTKYKSKISEEKSKITKAYTSIGELYYSSVKNTCNDAQIRIDAAVAEIDESNKKIAEYEAIIDDVKVKGKEEREGFKTQSDEECK